MEHENIRDAARRMVQEYRRKRNAARQPDDNPYADAEEEAGAAHPAANAGRVLLFDLMLSEQDAGFLRSMRVEPYG